MQVQPRRRQGVCILTPAKRVDYLQTANPDTHQMGRATHMTPKVKGSHPWALILCNTSDQPVPGWPGLDYFQTLIAAPNGNGLYTWWQQISGGRLDFQGSQVF